MLRRAALAPLLLCLAGCSEDPESQTQPPPVAPPAAVATLQSEAKPGTRLRPRFVRGEQVRIFLGWRDTARGEDCEFLTAGDGATRCLPGTRAELFADDQCTAPAVMPGSLEPCDPAPTVALLRTPGCDPRHTVHALGDRVSTVYFLSGGSCVGMSGAGPTYRLGPEIAPSTFVAARRETSPGSQALSVRRWVAEDGAEGGRELVDAGEGWPCYPTRYLGGPRCWPLPAAFAGISDFGDAACTAPALHPAPCPGAAHALHYDAGAYTFHVPGASSPAYRLDAGGACSLVDGSPTATQLLGPALPPERFAAGAAGAVGARLQLDVVRFPGVDLPSAQGVPRDGQDECFPHHAADGRLRCLPATPGGTIVLPPRVAGAGRPGDRVTLWADAACTALLYDARQTRVGEVLDAAACPRRVRVRRLGAMHTGIVYAGYPGSCRVYAQGTPTDMAPLGDEIAPSQFVPMALE